MFKNDIKIPLIYADESDLFLRELEGISDPEVKRKKIRQTVGKMYSSDYTSLAIVVLGFLSKRPSLAFL